MDKVKVVSVVAASYAVVAVSFLTAGCYSLAGDDRGAITTAATLDGSAYCDLAGIDAGPGDVGDRIARARAKVRVAHADQVSVLRRNGGPDAGLGVDCP